MLQRAAQSIFLALVFWASPAVASSLQVAPTSLSLKAERKADGLWLINAGGNPLRAQLRIYRWEQVNGEDQLLPTTDLLVSPPMVRLPGGTRQLVRVIRLTPPPTDTEASYRVIVDELPAPAADESGKRTGLQFVMRYSLPVFVQPPAGIHNGARPFLRVEIVREGDSPQLEIGNEGSAHAHLSDLVFVDATGQRHTLREGLAGYVLPSQRKRWSLPPALKSMHVSTGSFKARVNGELTERNLLQRGADATPSVGPR